MRKLCFSLSLFFVSVILVPAGSLYAEENKYFHPQFHQAVVERRNTFQQKLSKPLQLLQAYEAGQAVFEIRNDQPQPITLEGTDLFFSTNRIMKTIAIAPNDSDAVKAQKIFDFVDKYSDHAIALYEETAVLHEPRVFFNIFASGICDDASSNINFLAHEVGLKTRTWWLEGHVVPEIFHDNAWHVYDADALGIVRDSAGQVASLETLVAMGQANQLSAYNEIFASTHDNQSSVFDEKTIARYKVEEPYLNFMPGERTLFFDQPYMLTTDGKRLHQMLEKPDWLFEDSKRIGNFISEIPLKNLVAAFAEDQDSKQFKTFFPISGAFITLTKSDSVDAAQLPQIYARSFWAAAETWMSPLAFEGAGLKNTYYNLTLGIDNLTAYPVHKLEIRNLREILVTHPDAKLLLVHYYAHTSARFDAEISAQIAELNLTAN